MNVYALFHGNKGVTKEFELDPLVLINVKSQQNCVVMAVII